MKTLKSRKLNTRVGRSSAPCSRKPVVYGPCVVCGAPASVSPSSETLPCSGKTVGEFLVEHSVLELVSPSESSDASVCLCCFEELAKGGRLQGELEETLNGLRNKHFVFIVESSKLLGDAANASSFELESPDLLGTAEDPAGVEDCEEEIGKMDDEELDEKPFPESWAEDVEARILERNGPSKPGTEGRETRRRRKKSERACDVCSKTFRYRTEEDKTLFKFHQCRLKGGGSQAVKCGLCAFTAVKPSGLKTHMTAIHGNPQNHRCRFCSREFKNKSTQTRHEKAEHPDSFSKESFFCDCCGRTFKSLSALRTHRGDYDHPGVCEICGQDVSKLNLHVYMKHAAPPKCKMCGQGFKTIHERRVHMSSHGVGRGRRRTKYACPDCGRDFWAKPRMIRHRVRAHDFRPEEKYIFRCHLCEKEYYCKDTLKEHVNGHLGITPHVCPLCGYATNFDTSLRIHLRQVHKTRLSVVKASMKAKEVDDVLAPEEKKGPDPVDPIPVAV